MPIDFIYPDYEVVRNYDRCVGCRVCERQCANEAHYFDEAAGKMMADESSASTATGAFPFAPPGR